MFTPNYALLLSNQDKARLSWDKAININRFISEVRSNGRVAFMMLHVVCECVN